MSEVDTEEMQEVLEDNVEVIEEAVEAAVETATNEAQDIADAEPPKGNRVRNLSTR